MTRCGHKLIAIGCANVMVGPMANSHDIAVEVGLIKSEAQILDAIADGTFAVHAINFKTAYDEILPEWIDDIQT